MGHLHTIFNSPALGAPLLRVARIQVSATEAPTPTITRKPTTTPNSHPMPRLAIQSSFLNSSHGIRMTKIPVSGTSLIISVPFLSFISYSSRHLKQGIPDTESIRVFTKSIGMPVAIQDNVRDCCECCYLKVARL
jgi:hypothetical protein